MKSPFHEDGKVQIPVAKRAMVPVSCAAARDGGTPTCSGIGTLTSSVPMQAEFDVEQRLKTVDPETVVSRLFAPTRRPGKRFPQSVCLR